MAISKSAQAVAWLSEDSTRKQKEAAALFGVSEAAVSAALRVRNEFGCCPTCGQTMREGNSPGVKSKTQA